jgi:hypothetical protein
MKLMKLKLIAFLIYRTVYKTNDLCPATDLTENT